MRGQYIRDLERQLDRLWVGSQHVAVLKLGKDKFVLSDGSKSVRGHGAKLMRALKPLRDRCGAEKFWGAMEPFGIYHAKNPHVIEIDTEEEF